MAKTHKPITLKEEFVMHCIYIKKSRQYMYAYRKIALKASLTLLI